MACAYAMQSSAFIPIIRRCTKKTLLSGKAWCNLRNRKFIANGSQTYRLYHDAGKTSDPTVYCVDMRSDTLTVPSEKMREAMAWADVGDDVYGEDPTVNELQRKMAELFGMESALFVPSGTMGNLMCVMAHCQKRGMEVLLGDKCHIHLYEQGGISQIGGVHPRTVTNYTDGTFNLDQLRDQVRTNDAHYPITRLISLENTHNYCGGKVLPLDFISKVRTIADEHQLGVHVDGARVMNAAVALGLAPARILQDVDTVSMCFSKGLGAPVGSIVAGSEKLMNKAHRIRKVLGGGMRQVGILAAAAMVGIEDAVDRLTQDHRHAKELANAFNQHGQGQVKVDVDGVHSNIVMVQVLSNNLSATQLSDRLNTVTDEELLATKEGVVVSTLPFASRMVRIVTNCNISPEDIQLAISKIKYVMEELAMEKKI